MEFFAPLFTLTSLTRSIKHVKALQDTLGDYNDLCVQQEALQMWSESISQQPNGHCALLAMGHLIGVLETDKQGLRRTFPERFKIFVAHFSPPEVCCDQSAVGAKPDHLRFGHFKLPGTCQDVCLRANLYMPLLYGPV